MTPGTMPLKVVAHDQQGKLIKGFFQAADVSSPSELPEQSGRIPARVMLTTEEGKKIRVNLDDMKALFFVKSFEGRKEYSEIKFFESNPTHEGIWARLTFEDGESLEGVIRNSLQFLNEPAFFLKPPDPQSNNQLIYVVKSALKDFRVLGIRNHY